jgi:hypothetical protein
VANGLAINNCFGLVSLVLRLLGKATIVQEPLWNDCLGECLTGGRFRVLVVF